MEETISRWLVTAFVTVLGLIGLVMWSKALDEGVLIFGLGLVVFSVLFVFGQIKAHFEQRGAH